MLWDWAKRIGAGLILVGITLGLIAAIPLLSPQQDGSLPPDFRVVFVALGIAGGGVVILLACMLLAALFPSDDFRDL